MRADGTSSVAGPDPEGAPQPLARLRFAADSTAVRLALAQARAVLARLRLSEDCLCDVELVLAEVLNNILLHAYAQEPGEVVLDLQLTQDELICTVQDRGCPMPGGAPPAGHCAPVDVAPEALPEGGFGWFLIRSHAKALDYCREDAVNRLTLHLSLVPTGPD